MNFSRSELRLHLQSELSSVVTEDVPFRHWIIDDFLPVTFANLALDSFPSPGSSIWGHVAYEMQTKSSCSDLIKMPEPLNSLIIYLSSYEFVTLLETLTGISNLISDFDLDGGGLHQSRRGGSLAVHSDFSSHRHSGLSRRLNLIYYLNKDWKTSYGGSLDLYSSKGDQIIKTVEPSFNRAILFETTTTSFHGHSRPLTCPSDISRNSIALYYYTRRYHQDVRGRNTRWRLPSRKLPRLHLARQLACSLIWRSLLLNQSLSDKMVQIHDFLDTN